MKTKLMHRILACGGIAVLSAGLLAGCSPSGGSTSSSSDKPSGEITYALQSFAQPQIKPIIDEFTKETGITVKFASGPATDQDLLTQLVPAFTSNTSPYDVIDTGDPSVSALAAGGWLAPLSDVAVKEYTDDLSAGMAAAHKQWNQKDGNTYRLYHNFELGYSWSNEALLAANGLTTPKTWADIETVGAALKAKGIYSFADAASKPGLTFVYLAYLTAQAGGNLYQADAGTKQAFEFAKKLIDEGYAPKDALTWTYDQQNQAYMSDRVATMRQWTFFNDVAPANKEWYAPEKAVLVDPPAGPGGAKTWAGGWGMSVPKAAKNKSAAMKFVEWMNQPEVAIKLAKASSFFVTARTSVLDALGTSGIAKVLKHYSDSGFVTPRPYHPQAAKTETIVDEIGQSYLTGQMNINTAMSELKKQLADLG
ncbi:MAG: hypothetical protein B5766_09650 [Candidatus Lumbricidophila eiseniae]|uniref:Sugar ABC transporter substrate-binding protein n=1 Tax=Candidatus Lumbricidiphila eiseniae TaxID=1969409 RepID=A0A2A6FPX1_9MICO|nr:MAG: hypothetical protein B5766_09650 [Candidatus Lumbricidophila eiseniae]